MTKGNRKAKERRALRKRENGAAVGGEKMLGNCTRRGWGKGVVVSASFDPTDI